MRYQQIDNAHYNSDGRLNQDNDIGPNDTMVLTCISRELDRVAQTASTTPKCSEYGE